MTNKDGAAPVAHALFQEVEQLCALKFGFTFLTVLRTLPEDPVNVLRVHSSSPEDYPVGVLKPMGGTPWGKLVLEQGKQWLGNGEAEVLWAFPDAQLILSKGCEACACAPIQACGRVVGVLSLNAPRDTYSNSDLDQMSLIAGRLEDVL